MRGIQCLTMASHLGVYLGAHEQKMNDIYHNNENFMPINYNRTESGLFLKLTKHRQAGQARLPDRSCSFTFTLPRDYT